MYVHTEIMKLHHGAHHKTYVTNLNSTYEQYQSAESKTDVPKMIQLQQAIKFNGGGRSQVLLDISHSTSLGRSAPYCLCQCSPGG